jgi:hypothetical protein
MIIQYVYAGWLKNPSTMPAGVKHKLDQAGLSAGGHRLTTFTDAKGNYRLYGAVRGHGTLSVQGREFAVALGSGLPPNALRLN